MGTFTVPIQIGNLAGTQFTEVTALVDTGATYTTLPGSLLAGLGVVQEGYRRFELADNRVVEYPIGQARVRLEGQELIVLVVFGREDTDPLLGATSLEIFGLGVDPVRQLLVPITALLK
jgi:clan AA aspartic protease